MDTSRPTTVSRPTSFSTTSPDRQSFIDKARQSPEFILYLKAVQEECKRGEYFDDHNGGSIQKLQKYIVVNMDLNDEGNIDEWEEGKLQSGWIFSYSDGSHCRNPLLIGERIGELKKYHTWTTGNDGITRGEFDLIPYNFHMYGSRCARGIILRNQSGDEFSFNPVKALIEGNVVTYKSSYCHTTMMLYTPENFMAEQF